jgi:hypothetical protein
MAFDSVDPFGEWRDDLRMGKVCSTIANQWGNNTTPKDFIPEFDKSPASEEERQREMERKAMFWAKMHNATMKGK